MMRSKEDISRQLERLKEKNPRLNDVVVGRLSDIPLDEVSGFIEANWTRYYRDEARISFSPEFLRFNRVTDASRVLILDGKLVGTFLAIDAAYASERGSASGSYLTGLTTSEEHRGERLSQLAVLSVEHAIASRGDDFCIFWLDNRHAQQGSSFQTYRTRSKRTEWETLQTLHGKALDYATTVQLAKPAIIQRIAMRGIQTLFPSRVDAEPKGMDVVDFDPAMTAACLDFINSGDGMRRVYTTEELEQKLTFEEDPITAISSVLLRGDTVHGILYGFTNPVTEGVSYFQMDGALIDPTVSWSQKRAFFSAFEGRLLEHGCASSVVPGSVTRERMATLGYTPLMKQHIGANFYTDRVQGADLQHTLFELR
jgi:hypothetical protein